MPKNIAEYRSPDYTKHQNDWTTIRDCLDGQSAVKRKTVSYLPFPVALDDAVRNTKEYKTQYTIYLDGAVFVNHTSQAVEDLTAGIFKREPIIDDMPKGLEYFDPQTLSRELAFKTTAFGRSFALVDYPTTTGVVTRKDEDDKNIHAFVVTYDPTDIVDWDIKRIGGSTVLDRVVLRERIVDEEKETEVEQYRELSMVDGAYTVTMFDDNGTQIGEPTTPMAMGRTLDHITGAFVGVVTNTHTVDKSPVLGIAQSNIKHYQTWAELNHVQTYVGHPTLAITNAPSGFIKSAKENNIRIGIGASNALVIEGDKGDAKIIEINGTNIIHFKTLDKLEQSMTDQGARLRSNQKGGVESGDALMIRNSGDNSVMASIAVQVELAVIKCFGFIGEFMGVEVGEWVIDLNKKFIDEKLDSAMVREMSALVSAGQIPTSVLHNYLKRVGMLDIDADTTDLIALAKEENPASEPFTNPNIDGQ